MMHCRLLDDKVFPYGLYSVAIAEGGFYLIPSDKIIHLIPKSEVVIMY